MWGSTSPDNNTDCSWLNAPFNGGNPEYNEEYFNAHKSEWLDDNDNGFPTLKPEFDAATQIMGGDWRMPTNDEIQELLVNTTNKWVENFNGTGRNGYKFISTKDTSKYIFIPAAGNRQGSSSNYQGEVGGFWSSSSDTSVGSYAWSLVFDSEERYMGRSHPYIGRTVRGVL